MHAEADSGTQRELTWVSRDGSRRLFNGTWTGAFGKPAISPDGRRVAAVCNGRTWQVWLRSVAGREPAVRFTTQHATNLHSARTPDGCWMAYVSNVSGRDEADESPYVDPASARWVISTGGGYAPR